MFVNSNDMNFSKLKTEKVKAIIRRRSVRAPNTINLSWNLPSGECERQKKCSLVELARRAHVSPHALDRTDGKFRRQATFRKERALRRAFSFKNTSAL